MIERLQPGQEVIKLSSQGVFQSESAHASLLYVDDRPITLSDTIIQRRDALPVLLRFDNAPLPEWYLEKTKELPSYVWASGEDFESELRQFREWLTREKLTLRYFLNPSEASQRFSQKIARALGLPALTEEQVEWLRDKVAMKRKLFELGINVAPCAEVTCQEDIRRFADDYGWPVIVKPLDGYATFETYKLDARNIDAFELQFTGRFGMGSRRMVEKFIEGEEVECCALIQDGQVLDTYISYMPAAPIDIVDGALNANITLSSDERRKLTYDIAPVVQRIVDGMMLDHGYMHMEFFVSPPFGTITFGELALRLAGCEIPMNHSLSYGFGIFDELIDIHRFQEVNLKYSEDRCVGDLLLPATGGKVIAASSEDDLLALPGVLKARLKFSPGDIVLTQRASHFSAGYVHIEGESVDEVEKRMTETQEMFQFRTEDV